MEYFLIQEKDTGRSLVVPFMDRRLKSADYRTVCSLKRLASHGALAVSGDKRTIWADPWGGTWEQSAEVKNVSDAMEKWL